MKIYLMTSLSKKYLIKVLFFIIYTGDKMTISINEININDIVIDIRTSIEYNEFHYPNSINIPKNSLLSSPEIYLNKNKKYYLLCTKGHVSLYCAKILNALGYNCYSISGGIKSILSS